MERGFAKTLMTSTSSCSFGSLSGGSIDKISGPLEPDDHGRGFASGGLSAEENSEQIRANAKEARA